MPIIKSFKAIMPTPANAEKVAIRLENLSLESAKEIRSQNDESFVHLLVPKIENYYLRGSKKEITFKKIAENFEDFIEKEILLKDEKPAIYIYKQTKNQFSYTGIWTVSCIDDYINNRIKKHELTRPEREKGLIEYLQQTGIDANPVLITYPTHQYLENLIEDLTCTSSPLDFYLDQEHHQVWKVTDLNLIQEIELIFKIMPATYIADGHHRAAAASTFGIERRKLNLKHKGDEEYNFFSSVYICANQLDILPFHRFIKLQEQADEKKIMEFITQHFDVSDIDNENLIPKTNHQFGLYINKKAFLLKANNKLNGDVLHDLDVSLLQNYVLEPLLKIINPREDDRLNFIGGNINLLQHIKMIDDGEFDMVFFLYPTSITDLMKIADFGETMPPKSTWFEPKFPAGLITHEIK
jgi:uncharacterized protein (DUF1015 family)